MFKAYANVTNNLLIKDFDSRLVKYANIHVRSWARVRELMRLPRGQIEEIHFLCCECAKHDWESEKWLIKMCVNET